MLKAFKLNPFDQLGIEFATPEKVCLWLMARSSTVARRYRSNNPAARAVCVSRVD